MRLSLVLVLPCALSAIALPVIAGEADVVADTKPEITVGNRYHGAVAIEQKRGWPDWIEHPLPKSKFRGQELSWTAPSGRWCEAKVGKHGTIHIKRKHGHGHPNKEDRLKVKDCLVGLNDLALKDDWVASLMEITKNHYENDWDWGKMPHKRSVEDVEDVEKFEATESQQEAQDLQSRQGGPTYLGHEDDYEWLSPTQKQCSGHVSNGTVLINREYGPGRPNEHDTAKVMDCLKGLDHWAKTDAFLRGFMPKTHDHYTNHWAERSDEEVKQIQETHDLLKGQKEPPYHGEMKWLSAKNKHCFGHVGKHAQIFINHHGKDAKAHLRECLGGLDELAKTREKLRSLMPLTHKHYAKDLGLEYDGMEKRSVENVENVEDAEDVEDVEATNSVNAEDIQSTEAKDEEHSWVARSGKMCKGKLKKDNIIHIKRKHGLGHPTKKDAAKVFDCLDGLEEEAEHIPWLKAALPTTQHYYYSDWHKKRSVAEAGVVETEQDTQDLLEDHHISNPDILGKRTVEDVEAVESEQDSQWGKGKHIHWDGGSMKCSGRVRHGHVHIKRKHGIGHPNWKDQNKVSWCLNKFEEAATRDSYFMSLLPATQAYYNDWFATHKDPHGDVHPPKNEDDEGYN